MAIKQVTIVNLSAPYSIGRFSSQVAHSSMMNILHRGVWEGNKFIIDTTDDPDLQYWMKESFVKVVLKVWGGEKLESIKKQAESVGIRAALMIEDDGIKTSLTLGPASSEQLDPITKTLSLL